MLSHANVTATSEDSLPSTLSLAFIWNANSTYWAGDIRVIDLYIDGQRRYSISIPQSDAPATQAVSLPFKSQKARIPGIPESNVDYLIIKNLDTTRKITLQAGIFNKTEGNTFTRGYDGEYRREVRFSREDVSIDLDLSSLTLGNHYNIIATHESVRTSIGSSFWTGRGLYTRVEEDGLCRQISRPVQQRAPVVSSSARPAADSPCSIEFKRRRDNASNPLERLYFDLVLAKKYEDAISFASNMGDQVSGGKLILDLLKHREILGIDVNAMNNNVRRQTPMHRAAMNRQWHAYYALAEHGANSFLPDSSGMGAGDYRRSNGGMSVFQTIEQNIAIRRDLFGDTAPAAEAFINGVDGANPECRIS